MRFDPEKHYRRSLRLKNRDYSRDGYYFVTICARNRENLFADLKVRLATAHDLTLTATGRIIKDNWNKIADHNVKTDAFAIMPNHIHGIIIIKPHHLGVGVGLAPTPVNIDEKGHLQGLPLHNENAHAPELGSIIGAFKSRCVMEYLKFIDENNLNESAQIWQRNYYEHIIRDQKELAAIRNYIQSNPFNWDRDKENPSNF